MLEHGEAKVLIADQEFSPVVGKALKPGIEVIDVEDPEFTAASGSASRPTKSCWRRAIREFAWRWPQDEWEAISLNYTSGTTGNPKGVVYHHRGAYLNAVGNILVWGMPHHAVYLWTLPMFHCNGWCFPWTMAANAGTNVCLRRVEAELDVRAHQAAPGHPLLRRADRAPDADQRPR